MTNNIINIHGGRGRSQQDEEDSSVQEPCVTLINEAFLLARRVERIGGPGQGERLARMTELLKKGSLTEAMQKRDLIRSDLQFMRCLWAAFIGLLACFALAYFVSPAWLIAAFVVFLVLAVCAAAARDGSI